MYIYAIYNKSNNAIISYFPNVVEACIEFNKHYCLETHLIKRYKVEYDNDVEKREIYDVMKAILDVDARTFKKISINAVQDEVDKGYTTTMERERRTHTNPKFRKFHEQMQKHDGHSEMWWNRFPDKHDTEQ
jgi:hypothetical protein